MDANQLAIAFTLLIHCSALSMMAVGGGVVSLTPEIERFAVEGHHWLTADAFLAGYTIAQVAPGPNVTFVTALGWQVAGLAGALAATAGILVPSTLFNLAVVRWGRGRGGRWTTLLRRSLVPLSVGLLMASAVALTRLAVHDRAGSVLLVLTVVLTLRSRINPVWLILAGGACAALGWV